MGGIPVSWLKKPQGGEPVLSVGFEIASAATEESRVVCKSEVANAHTVNMSTFEEGLGRVMHVAGALEHERPFFSRWANL